MKTRAQVLGSCIILIASVIGCGGPVTRSDLAGSYLANYGFAREELTLHPNGDFTQRIRIVATGRIANTNGTWRFDPKERDIVLSEQFMVVANGFGEMVANFDRPTRHAIAILPVRRSFGSLQIGLSPRVPYTRQAGKPRQQ